MVSNERPPRAPQDQIGPNSVHILTLLSILNKEKIHFRHQHCQGVCNNGLNWHKKVTNFIFNIHLEKFHPYPILQKWIPPAPPAAHFFSRLSLKSEIMDGFWSSRCLNDHIDLPDKIGSFLGGAATPMVVKNGTEKLFFDFNFGA